MPTLISATSTADPRFEQNEQAQRALVADLRDRLAVGRCGRARSDRASVTSRAASCCRASASTCCSTRAARSSRSRRSPRPACTTTRAPRAGVIAGHRPGARPAGARHLERRDGQGRHVLPDDGQEAPAGAGDRAREPPAVHLPRRLRAAPSCRCRTRSSPTATTSAASSTTRLGCRRRSIPQIAAVLGSCTAGGAYVPAMSDETVIVRNQGTIFLGGPPLVKAAIGEVVTAEELGGGDLHARISGVVDHLAENDRHALADRARHRRDAARPGRRPRGTCCEPREPLADPAELYGVVPTDVQAPYDVREVIARLVDGSEFHEFKREYGDHPRHRVRAHARASGGHRRQQRRAVQRVGAEGRALHRAVRPARHSAAVPPEHLRLHGRPRLRGRRHREARRQDGHRRRDGPGAEAHGRDRRLVRRRQLLDVRPRVLSAVPLDVAGRAHLGDGRPAGRIRARDREARPARGPRRGVVRRGRGRVQSPDPRAVRDARAAPTTRPRASGTTASSTRPTPARCSASPSRCARARLCPRRPSACSGCDRRDAPFRHRARRQPRRDRLPCHPHPARPRHPLRRRVQRRRQGCAARRPRGRRRASRPGRRPPELPRRAAILARPTRPGRRPCIPATASSPRTPSSPRPARAPASSSSVPACAPSR